MDGNVARHHYGYAEMYDMVRQLTFLMTSLGSAMPVIEHTNFTVEP